VCHQKGEKGDRIKGISRHNQILSERRSRKGNDGLVPGVGRVSQSDRQLGDPLRGLIRCLDAVCTLYSPVTITN
jgi:hypothetical protein